MNAYFGPSSDFVQTRDTNAIVKVFRPRHILRLQNWSEEAKRPQNTIFRARRSKYVSSVRYVALIDFILRAGMYPWGPIGRCGKLNLYRRM